MKVRFYRASTLKILLYKLTLRSSINILNILSLSTRNVVKHSSRFVNFIEPSSVAKESPA